MRRFAVGLGFLMSATSTTVSGQAAAPNGTYLVAVCRAAPCVPTDTVTPYLVATLVLFNDDGDAAQGVLPRRQRVEGDNGCYQVRHRRNQPDSYAGIRDHWWTAWQWDSEHPGDIVVGLFWSLDASYAARLRLRDGLWTGSGRSWGVGATAISAPTDTVVAVRLGPPAWRHCGSWARWPPN
jgi:hypothetical protein